eukprot:3564835-Amphidinium_carterae.1
MSTNAGNHCSATVSSFIFVAGLRYLHPHRQLCLAFTHPWRHFLSWVRRFQPPQLTISERLCHCVNAQGSALSSWAEGSSRLSSPLKPCFSSSGYDKTSVAERESSWDARISYGPVELSAQPPVQVTHHYWCLHHSQERGTPGCHPSSNPAQAIGRHQQSSNAPKLVSVS